MQSESFAAVDGRWVMLFLAISPGSEARLVCDDITRATQTTRADKWFEFVRFQTPRDASTCRLVVAPLGTSPTPQSCEEARCPRSPRIRLS